MVSHAHGQGYADLHFVIPETIDKVDFNKGPYYANHGDFNTSGYVDFNTKNALHENLIKLEGGSYNTWRTVALINVIGGSNTEHNLYLAGEFFYTRSYFDLPQNFNRTNLFAKYSGLIDGKTQLQVSASTFTSRWDQSGQVPDRAINQYHWISRFGALDETEGGHTSRSNVNARLTTSLSDDSYLNNQVFFSNYDFTLWSNFTFWQNDTLTGDQIQQEEQRKIYGYKGNYVRVDEIGNSTIRSEFGMGIRQDDIPRILLFNNFERNITLDTLAYGQVDQTNFSLFFSEMITFSNKFSMNIGLRYDHFFLKYVDDTQAAYTVYSDNAGILNPKLNLYYNLSKDFQLYLRAGSGFHSNDARTLYEKRSDLILPRAVGADLGTFVKPVESIVLNLAIWTIYLEEELVYVGDEAIVEPSDETQRLGFDISLRYQLLRDLYLDLDYNYAWGRLINEPDGANYIPLAPTHTSMGGITYRSVGGIGASLRYRYVSDRPANEDNSVRALGSTVIDLALSYRIPQIELYFRIENLFNVEWNEAQFDTESRLRGPDENGKFNGQLESQSVSELHYTPGSPLFIRGGIMFFL